MMSKSPLVFIKRLHLLNLRLVNLRSLVNPVIEEVLYVTKEPQKSIIIVYPYNSTISQETQSIDEVDF